MIRFKCPHCSKSYRVADAAAGKTGTCVKCSGPFYVPTPKPVRNEPSGGEQADAIDAYLNAQEAAQGLPPWVEVVEEAPPLEPRRHKKAPAVPEWVKEAQETTSPAPRRHEDDEPPIENASKVWKKVQLAGAGVFFLGIAFMWPVLAFNRTSPSSAAGSPANDPSGWCLPIAFILGAIGFGVALFAHMQLSPAAAKARKIPRRSPTPTPAQEQKAQQAAGVVAFFVIVLVCVVVSSSNSSKDRSSDDKKDEPNKAAAWEAAQHFVKKKMKAPSTASFGSVWGEFQDPSKCVTSTGDKTFRVQGWVDGQNSFGAMIRTNFVCELRYVGNSNYVLDGILFDE